MIGTLLSSLGQRILFGLTFGRRGRDATALYRDLERRSEEAERLYRDLERGAAKLDERERALEHRATELNNQARMIAAVETRFAGAIELEAPPRQSHGQSHVGPRAQHVSGTWFVISPTAHLEQCDNDPIQAYPEMYAAYRCRARNPQEFEWRLRTMPLHYMRVLLNRGGPDALFQAALADPDNSGEAGCLV